MTRRRGKFDASLLIPFAAAALMVAGWPLAPDHDLFLHLKTGEMIWQGGAFPFLERFTFTAAGRPDEAHSWLSQLILWGIYRTSGETGLRVLNFVLVAGILTIAYRFLVQRTAQWAVALFGACLVLGIHHSVQILRPLLFGELCFAMLVFGGLQSRSRVLLFFLTVLWVNLHGSALIALPAALIYAAFSFRMSWSLPLVVLAGLMVNPLGPRVFEAAWAIAQVAKTSGILEWQVALPFDWTSSTFAIHLDIRSLLVQGLVPLTLVQLYRTRSGEWALAVFFSLLPILSVRHTSFLIYPVVLSLSLITVPLRSAVLVVASLAALFFFRVTESYYALPVPVKAVNFVEDAGLTGNALNFPGYGSYFIYRLYPQVKVGFDRRMGVHQAYYRDENLDMEQYGGLIIGELAKKYPQADLAVFPSFAPLTTSLGKDWLLIFRNNEVAIAAKRSAERNLSRVEKYYRDRNVPFERGVGFDLARVYREAPRWFFNQQESAALGWWPAEEEKVAWEKKQIEFLGSVARERALP